MGSPEKPIDVELGNMEATVAISNGGEKVEEPQQNINDESAPLNDEKQEEDEAVTESDRFTGLKKEELMEIANQPQWRRARWVLFVLFWILWIGMLVAAILLVWSAPKCKPTPTTQWYQDAVLYKADPKNFAGDYKGMSKNMKYIKDMKTTLVLTDVMGNDMVTPLNNAADFNALVEAAHKDGVKVVVEMKVDSLSTSASLFNESQQVLCSNSATDVCSMFQWAAAASAGFVQSASAKRTDNFYKGTADMATVNYASNYSQNYLNSAIKAWLNRGVDGVLINDLAQVDTQVVQSEFDAVNKMATEEKTYALFVEASDVTKSMEMSKQFSVAGNSSVGVPNPVVVYKSLSGSDFKSFTSTVETLRTNDTRGFAAFQNDATVSEVNQSLALTLLNLGLPGVPVMKSGEELGSVSKYNKFTWDSEKAHDKPVESVEVEESKFALDMVQNMVKKRVADTLSKPALRYDTRDMDTTFFFLNKTVSASDDVIVYCRKWGKKPAVMVVSNIGSSEQDVNIYYKNCDEGLEKAKVLVSSTSKYENRKTGDSFKMEDLKKLPGYTTLVLTAA